MSVNLEIDDVYVWKEADPVEVSCHDYLDVTEAPEKMRLWWELNGKKKKKFDSQYVLQKHML